MTLQNRSLDRGIAVIEALARGGAMSLADLHRATGLPKSTIRRLLATLTRRRFVHRSLADGRYRAAVTLPDLSAEPVPPRLALIADAALPRALELTAKMGWPSDIQVLDGIAMRIVDSTRPASPFHLYRGQINRRVSLWGSATGLACLAAMPDAEVERLHRETEGDTTWGLARFGMTLTEFLKERALAQARGYGARLAIYLGETVLDDALHAIAVPLTLNGAPVGGLSLLWPRSFKSVAEFADAHAGALRRTAAAISTDLDRLSATP
ncbi:MAG: helix-turn-helix domain-containing protein [Rhodobacter sp.]|nr:helix-turn-helix domain-containing protein [Rhodobacter sp.]